MIEEEIDLRQYVAVVFKYWYWIIGLAIVAALVAFVASSFSPPTYQATALVAAIQPRYELQFDRRFQSIPETYNQALLESQYRTYPALATSDGLLQEVAEKTGWDLSRLQQAVQASEGSEPTLLTLKVKGKNADEVAGVANVWAEVFVKNANRLYGHSEELARFKQQRESAAEALAEADAALATFREENGFGFNSSHSNASNDRSERSSNVVIRTEFNPIDQFGLIGQRLETKNHLLTGYEAELVRLRQMQREIEMLSATATADSAPVLIAGLLSEMINAGIVETAQTYQIQLGSVDPAASLAAMAKALEARTAAIEAEIEALQTDIHAIQGELAAKQGELEQLTRERDIRAETYIVISRKVQEAQISTASDSSTGGTLQIASRAAVPSQSVSSGRLVNTVLAGVLGLLVGIFAVLAIEWWRADHTLSPATDKKKKEADNQSASESILQ